MKFMRIGLPNRERPAVLIEDEAIDISSVVAEFDELFFAEQMEVVRDLTASGADGLPRIDLEAERIGPPIPKPEKIVCIGLNYEDHASETGAEVPTEPPIFMKAPNTVVGPHDDVLIPKGSERTDWEIELGVIIGRRARYLDSVQDARHVVAGYCLSSDLSERAFQLKRGGQWTKGKSCETFNPLGPWLVTPDEIADPQDLEMVLRVNGSVKQQSSTRNMLVGVFELVHYLSQFMVLEPGDLINTGTPAGVGLAQSPRQFLHAGDVMELEIEGLGYQRTECRDAV